LHCGGLHQYDSHAVQQMDRNIELIRYRQFGKELLLLELANAVAAESASVKKPKGTKSVGTDKAIVEWLAEMTQTLRAVFESLDGYLTSLGDDVQRKDLKLYIAFKRLRNFVIVCFQKNNLVVYLHLDPDKVDLVEGFTRDVREIGHWGTGNVEVTLRNLVDLNKAKPLLLQAYEEEPVQTSVTCGRVSGVRHPQGSRSGGEIRLKI
jgi:predicted transport protein